MHRARLRRPPPPSSRRRSRRAATRGRRGAARGRAGAARASSCPRSACRRRPRGRAAVLEHVRDVVGGRRRVLVAGDERASGRAGCRSGARSPRAPSRRCPRCPTARARRGSRSRAAGRRGCSRRRDAGCPGSARGPGRRSGRRARAAARRARPGRRAPSGADAQPLAAVGEHLELVRRCRRCAGPGRRTAPSPSGRRRSCCRSSRRACSGRASTDRART